MRSVAPVHRPLYLLCLFTVPLVSVPVPAAAKPLVDCSKKEFKQPNSARSLYLWTDGAEEKVIKAKKEGVFGTKPGNVQGTAISADYCKKMISYRGTAHCKEPGNDEYRKGLARLIKVCDEAMKPVKAPAREGIDCKDKRFSNPEANVDLLLRWTELALKGLEGLQRHEGFRVKVNCDRAFQNAGTAYCKAPDNPKIIAAVKHVRKTCAAAQAKLEVAQAKEQADAKAAVEAAKANRKIVPFPRSTYRGGGAAGLSLAIKQALLAARVAKGPKEVLRAQPMGTWQSGHYAGTRVPYKKLMGTVLWFDKDRDGVCRFTSYKFVKDRKGGKWSKLRFKAFCLSCPEGWTRCK